MRGSEIWELHPATEQADPDAHESGTFLKIDGRSHADAAPESALPESGVRVKTSALGYELCDAATSLPGTCRKWAEFIPYKDEPTPSEDFRSGPLEGLRWVCTAYATIGLIGTAVWAAFHFIG